MIKTTHITPTRFVAEVALAIALTCTAVAANATLITVTAEVTELTMGDFGSATVLQSHGLSVNGNNIPVCTSAFSCQTAFNQPSTVAVPLTGTGVTFGYDTSLFPGARMNQLAFTGNAVDSANARSFQLATLSFTNGMFYPLVGVQFKLTTHSSSPTFDDHTFYGRLILQSNSAQVPSSDPQYAYQEADFITVQADNRYPIVISNPTGPGDALFAGVWFTLTYLGSFRVFDWGPFCPPGDPLAPNCNVGTVDFIGHFGSLYLDALANPTGGGFLDSSTTAALNGPGAGLSEPATLSVLALALAALGFSRRKMKKTRNSL